MSDDIDVAKLAKRVDELESRATIEQLIARYCHAVDRVDRDLMASIWHEDAIFDLGDDIGAFEGIGEILEGADGFWSDSEWMHHWCPNALITLDGDSASAVVNLDCMVRGEEGTMMVAGNYFDRYERRNGVWKFAERKFVMDYSTTFENWTPTAGLQR